ncbi:MAG: alpha/beta hydrolase [Actinomycetota bacterium]|nr:alpha/beta hydrolase [Actinomycetota bacterium]
MGRRELRSGVRRVLKFLRRVESGDPRKPVPPPLPGGRTVTVEGRGEMFVREIPGGEGDPTIVLLHGWTLSADLNWFSGVYDVASQHGRVLAPDIRGHGRGLRSEVPFTLEAAADDLACLIEQLDAGPAVLVGYSMGGSIALLCAARHPHLVAALVLASVGVQWRDDLWERIIWLGMGFTEYVLRWGAPEGIVERYLRHAVEQSPDLEPYLGWVKAETRRGDPSAIGHAASALAKFDASELVKDINVPTAVVVTKHDALIRERRQRELVEAMEGAHVVEVDGKHNAWMVLPEEWSAAIGEGIEYVTSHNPATQGDPTTRGEGRAIEEAGTGEEEREKVAS